MNDSPQRPTVVVIGGGLAGLAACVAACDRGLRVEWFERRKMLGGRACSLREPKTEELIDHCQHVSMGCCTALADFRRRTGIADSFIRQKRLNFLGPDGKRYNIAASRWLPAPLHLLPGLMRLRYLSLGERWSIAGVMRHLARETTDDRETIGTWLRRHGQSQRAIDRFWSVVLLGALAESADRASLAAARKVFVDAFLASRNGYELEIPTLPLSEIFDRRVGAWLAEHNVVVHRATRIKRIEGERHRATAVVLPDGTRREFDFVIVAVPWQRVRSLFSETMLAVLPELQNVEKFQPAAITAVHLWFDRPITSVPHAALVGRLSQWFFGGGRTASGYYCQVVISASRELLGCRSAEVVARVCDELREVFPDARDARLLHGRVVTQPSAVFSMTPGLDRFRPTQRTQVENLLLAGDWTATGWPGTMEGAVRSGYLAVEALPL